MRKIFTLILFIFLFSSTYIFAQTFWKPEGNVKGTVFSFGCDSNGTVYAGSYNALLKQDTESETWKNAITGSSNYTNFISIAVTPNGHMFSGTHQAKIHKSTDNGVTWTGITSLPFADVRPLIALKNGDLLACPIYEGLYRTTDEGNTWLKDTYGLPPKLLDIWSLAVAKNGDILAGTNKGLFKSTDNGYNWLQLNFDSLCYKIHSLLILKNGDILAGGEKFYCGIFRSRDNGITWEKTFTGLDTNLYEFVFSMVENPVNNEIYVSTNNDGVYISKDGGYNAKKVTDGIVDIDSTKFYWQVFLSPGGYLYLGTSRGMYRSTNIVTGVDDPDDFELNSLSCLPNPANDKVTINYNVVKPGYVNLSITDIYGRAVDKSESYTSSPGNYNIEFNIQDLPAGIYFCRMESGGETKIKKLCIIK